MQTGIGSRLRIFLLIVFGLVCSALVYGLYLAAVRTFDGQRLDEAAMVGRTEHPTVRHVSGVVLDTISVTSLIVAAVVFAVLALVRRRPRVALGIGIVILGANVTTQLLKRAVLSRPDLLHRPDGAIGPSLPSGHATVAMSVALALVMVVPPRLRVLCGSLGIAYAATIGIATLTSAWHRPSDVIAAYLVAAAWTAIVIAVILTRGARPAPQPAFLGRTLSTRRLVLAGVGLVTIAAIVGGTVLTVLQGRKLTNTEVVPAYLAAVAAIGGVSLMILGILLWLLQGTQLDPPALDAAPAPELPPPTAEAAAAADPDRPSSMDTSTPVDGPP